MIEEHYGDQVAELPGLRRGVVVHPGQRADPADQRRAAHGVLTSKDAESITRHFKATGPIQIDVSTVKRYAQAGCARLKVSFAQDGVQLPGQAAPRRNTVDFGINYCRDGQPPKSLT